MTRKTHMEKWLDYCEVDKIDDDGCEIDMFDKYIGDWGIPV